MPMESLRITEMASATTSSIMIPAPAVSAAGVRSHRRRRISPQAGRALEILGHAIEYLTDEFVHEGEAFSVRREQLEAVRLLMAANREIYLECPEVPSFGERCRSFLRFHTA
jgi:hypothetical protein